MSQADIQRMYEEKGLDALWSWAKGRPDRWKSLAAWAADAARDLKKDLADTRNEVEQFRDELHELQEGIIALRKNKADAAKNLEEAKEAGKPDERISELESRLREIDQNLQGELRELAKADTAKKRAKVAAHDQKRERLAWIERKVIYREKWEKAKKRQESKGGGFDNAEWEDWMASGLDANVTPLVKKVLAWGVLDYDLTITSMRRNYVPPGGSTTSFHLQGLAGDIAGARMVEFQKAVYDKFLGNAACKELFGPDNGLNLKYGGKLYLGEGTALENLHDTHVHFAG